MLDPWESKFVSNRSTVTAGRGVRSVYVAHRKGILHVCHRGKEACFLLLSSPTALTPFYVLDDKLLVRVSFTWCCLILVDLQYYLVV